ncbi:sulfurtransferase, partial [Streptomyces hydrogenans]
LVEGQSTLGSASGRDRLRGDLLGQAIVELVLELPGPALGGGREGVPEPLDGGLEGGVGDR